MLITSCVCDSSSFLQTFLHNIPLNECTKCGVLHQRVDLSKQSYFDFYKTDYHKEHQGSLGLMPYEQRYVHDKNIAEMRRQAYSEFLSPTSRILDIGSSNNAFVDHMIENGYTANGVELGEELASSKAKTTYNKDLLDIHFPPDSFDFITMHDVFEHLIAPVEYLAECHKILSAGGMLVIDFPNYFSDAGTHHWRPTQHLWYFTPSQLENLLNTNGFEVVRITNPVESKLVFYAKKRKEAPTTRILVFPGMGDIYWSLVKLESFCKHHNISNPELYVWNMDGRPRSESYLKKIPFVKNGGYYNEPLNDTNRRVFDNAYHGTQSIVKDFEGFEWFIGVNGMLTSGFTLDTHPLSQYESNWYIPMFESIEEREAGKQYKKLFGKYIVAFVGDLGMFKNWTKVMTPTVVHTILSSIASKLGVKIIMTGLEWDLPYTREIMALDKKSQFVNLVGETNLDQFFGLAKNSMGVWGWCGGNTIKTTMMKIPTMVYWSTKQFPKTSFHTTCVPPDSVNKWYVPKIVEQLDVNRDIDDAIKLFTNTYNYIPTNSPVVKPTNLQQVRKGVE